ncbi:MAG: prepilin peptidase [Candidatus Aenigmarchaeota archaeon]|nr:prepilin peptidase [Candidatus Aenigmarchaeota archaeon]
MFETIALSIAFIGSVIAGIWDLFTTEVPDEVPALMIALGIFNWFVYSLSSGDSTPLIVSLLAGTSLLVFGLTLYRAGHWGGADAWLLAAIGYNIPLYNNQVFLPSFLFNFLIVGSVYMVIYAIILGVKNQGVFSYFINDVKKSRLVSGTVLVSLIILLVFYILAYRILPIAEAVALIIFLVFFWKYAKVIEKRVFRKRVRTSQLRVGDVLEDMLWRGITAEEIKKIRRIKRFVIIKEGVRFVPAFPIALAVTFLVGNLIFLII